MIKKILIILVILNNVAYASEIIPVGNDNNQFYYKIGGGSDFSLPPVSDTNTIALNSNANLGLGNSCGSFNPALSIANTLNELKDSVDNIENSILVNATGALISMPMYLLAQANPSAYQLLNSNLLNAHKKMEISTKSCQAVKDQISQGQNPYRDWGTIAVNDQWKKHLTLVSSDSEDINHAKKQIDERSGDDGVIWVQGKSDSDGSLRAGGNGGQPPIHVIADTVHAGFNAMLNRPLDSNQDVSVSGSSSGLAHYFKNPIAASDWITTVVGDQIITTREFKCQVQHDDELVAK